MRGKVGKFMILWKEIPTRESDRRSFMLNESDLFVDTFIFLRERCLTFDIWEDVYCYERLNQWKKRKEQRRKMHIKYLTESKLRLDILRYSK